MSLRKFIRHTRLLIQQGLYETRKISNVGQQRALELTRLEERVLFSASAIGPVVAEIAEAGGSIFADSAPVDNATAFHVPDQQLLDLVADSALPAQTTDQNSNATDPAQHTLELVFLDSSINNIEQMKSDLQASSASDSSRTLEFVVLDSTKDGIAQITSALLRYNGIDGLHIVSHGDAGEVQLGSTTLSLDNLDRYRTAISAWQYSLSDKADILFYGSNLAASEYGRTLLSEFSALTHTDVAASNDLIETPTIGRTIGDGAILNENVSVASSSEIATTSSLGFHSSGGAAQSTDAPLQFNTNSGHVLAFGQSSIIVAAMDHVLQVEMVGANSVPPLSENSDFSTGVGTTGNQAFTQVTYTGLWDGITATWDATEDAILKSTYYVNAGAAVGQIQLKYNRSVSLDQQGKLVIGFENGTMTDSAPVAWQDIDGHRIFIDVHYALQGDNQVGFAVGAYDHDYQLVIDPTLTWSTFLGGSGTDDAQFIAMDGSGNIFVTGSSASTWGSPVRAFGGGGNDAYVAKLNSSGTVVWTTFLGGSGTDLGHAIAVDASGNIYVSGDSSATWGSPVRAISSGTDGFAAKLDSSGALVWNTFLGGSGTDNSWGIGVDSSGNVYVSGDSTAAWGSPLRSYSSGSDVYAAKLNSSGSLTWSTFLGGSGSDINNGIAVDTSGNVYVGGYSTASWGTPVRAYTSGQDFSIIKLDTSGSIIWNTFLGGSGTDAGLGIAVDGSGNVYVTGNSSATWGSPVNAISSGTDAVAAKLNSSGNLVWNTFLGGSGTDNGRRIAVDGSGNVFLAGSSTATWGSPDQAYSSGTDAFAAELDGSGNRIWHTFIGGNGTDVANGIAVDGGGNVYLAGSSTSTWGSPVQSLAGGQDAFVVKFNPETTVSKRVAADNDDAEEEGPTGTTPNRMWLDSSDLELVSDFESPSTGEQKVGLRFTSMNIPAGATITDAYLVFRAISADSGMNNTGATNLTFNGQLTGNASTFTTTSGNISSRTLTAASTAWAPTAWTTGQDYSSPDISSVIQEIVNQGTWASGNALAIIISGTGHRASPSHDGDSSNAAQLFVTYTTAPPVNTSPVLDNSGTMTLTTITEDQTTNTGNTVASIITSAGGNRITDVDSGAAEGIAITSLVSSSGAWQYSLNSGSTWSNVGDVSSTSALLLRETDLVRFVPNTQTGTTASFDFRAWDQTTGTAGTRADASTNGGITAFSTATETASIVVSDINDGPSFDSGTGLVTTGFAVGATEFINAVTIQPDGKIIAVGYTQNAGNQDFAIVRYNADGSLDTSFGGGTGKVTTAIGVSSENAQSVVVLANGKILVAGSVLVSGFWDIALVQYNADGTLDTSFGSANGIAISGISSSDEGYSLAVQSDGKILVAGGTNNDFILARFLSNGTLDTSFGASGSVTTDFAGSNDRALSMALQVDGKILLGGYAVGGASFDFGVARYNTDGTLDTTFNGTGKATVDFGTNSDDSGRSLTLQADGKILISGWSNAGGTNDFGLVRLNANGSLDTTFNGTGKVTTAIGTGSDLGIGVTVQADGKILMVGQSNTAGGNFAAVRYNSNGSLDTTFNGTGKVDTNFGGSSDDRGAAIAVQTDGKIVLGGTSTINGNHDFAVARYNADGTLDTRFNTSNTLGGTIAYTENAAAVVLDNNVLVFDAELSALNNFSGATLTLARNGGANAQDLFSATGLLATLTQSGSLVYNGTTIGTVTTNSNGSLVLTFNSNATQTLVNSAMRLIGYSNSSDAPPASVQINWTFNDGNSGAQGTGGALVATGSTTVAIASVNDAPTLGNGTLAAVNEDTASPTGQSVSTIFSGQFSDPDTSSSFGGIAVVGNTANSGTQGTWQYSSNGGTHWFAIGTVADNSTALAIGASTLIRFVPVADYAGTPPALVVRGLDNSYVAGFSTTAGSETRVNINTTTNGGTTAIAAATANLSTTITAVNDAPVRTAGAVANLTVLEDSGFTSLGFGSVAYSPGGGSDESGQTLTYAVTAVPSGTIGNVYLADGTTLVTTGAYTLSQIQGMQFQTTANGNGVAGFQYNVTDSGGTANGGQNGISEFILITVTAVNDAPVRTAGSPAAINVNEDIANVTAVTLGMGGLTYGPGGGSDESSQTLTYTVTVIPAHMTLWKADGVTQVTASTVITLTELQGLKYKTVVDANGTGNLTWSVVDNGGTTNGGVNTLTETLAITVNAVNDAPVLDTPGPTLTLTTINEDETANVGNTVASIIASAGGDRITDVDVGSVEGIAIRAHNSGNGIWQYTTDGSTWINIGGVSDTSALLLRDTDRVRLLPNATSATSAFFVFRAWDQTSGTAGTKVDVSVNGGSTPFSNTVETASITVTEVNDAPVVTATGSTLPYTENQSAVAVDGALTVSDIDSTNLTGATVRIVGNYANGQDVLAFSNQLGITGVWNAGTGILTLSGTTTVADYQTALRTVTYVNSSDSPSSLLRTVSFTVNDGAANASASRNISVTTVNDAPSLSNGVLAAVNEDTISPAGQTVSTIFTGQFSDVDSGSSLSGIAVVGNTANAGTQGIWQYSTNSGTNWFAIGSVTDGATALAISNSTLIRFVPVADYIGTPPALVVRGLDNSYVAGFSTTAGSETRVNVNTTTNGGTTAIDAATANLSTSITAVNDAPVRTAGTVANLTILEDSGFTSLGFGSVAYSPGGGADESGQTLTYSVTAVPSGTIGNVYLADGTTLVTTGAYTLSQIQGMQFQTTANGNGVAGFQYNVTDNGGTANGGQNGISEFILITVTAVNDVPVRTGGTPAAINVNEDSTNVTAVTLGMGALTYGPGGGSDESSQTLTYTVTAIPSHMTLWKADGVTQVTASTVVTLTELQGLKYKTVADANGTGNLTWTVVDNGGTANGGANTLTETLALTVNAVNDDPMVDLNGSNGAGISYATSFTENDPPVLVADIDATISDIDDANYNRFTVTLSGFADGNKEHINIAGRRFDNTVPATHTETVGSTAFAINFSGSQFVITRDGGGILPQADLQALLRTITYENVDKDPTLGTRTLTFVAQDSSGLDSAVATSTIISGAINDAPTVTMFAGPVDTTNENTEVEVTFAELGAQGNEADVDGTVDAFVIKSVASGTLKIGTSSGTATAWVLGINDTIDVTNHAYWTPDADANGTLNAFAAVAKDDQGAESVSGITAQVSVTAVNDAPVRTAGAPAAINVNEDSAYVTAVTLGMGALTYGSGGGADESGQTLTYTVTVIPAHMTVWKTDGVTQVTASDVITLAELQGLKYKTVANAVGTGNLTWTVVDNGGTANGGVNTLTETLSITVNAVNDAPVRTTGAPAAINVSEDSANVTAVTLGMGGLTYGPGGDADESGQTLTYTVTAIPAHMTLWKADGVTQVTASTVITLTELQGLKYKTFADANGTGNLTWLVVDNGGTANGGVNTLTETLSITVNAVNDAPVITSNGAGATAAINVRENVTDVTTVTSSDVDFPAQTLTYSIAGGVDSARFSITSSTGVLSFLVAPDFENPTDAGNNNTYDVIVQVSDGVGGIDTQGIAVTILNNPRIFDQFGATSYSNNDGDQNWQSTWTEIGESNGVNSGVVRVSSSGYMQIGGDEVSISGKGASRSADLTGATQAILSFDYRRVNLDEGGGSVQLQVRNGGAWNTLATYSLSSFEGSFVNASFDISAYASSNTEIRLIGSGSTEAYLRIDNVSIEHNGVASNSAPTIISNGGGDTSSINVAENSSAVTTVIATDPEAPPQVLTFSIAGGDDAIRFTIDSSTGVLSFVTTPNAEMPADLDGDNVYQVVVDVSDGVGGTDQQLISVTVTDVNEFAVGPVTDSNVAANSVAEDATIGTTVGITAFASDADATTNSITYTLDDSAGGRFAIDGSTGVVTVAAGLDYETSTSHSITIRATSADGSFSTQLFAISVTDVNESGVSAISDSDVMADFVLENTVNGTNVGITAFASDADGTDTVSYSLDDSADGRFAIHAVTGVVTVAGGIDREAAGSYTITVRANSTDSSTVTQVFTITIGDVNEFAVGSVIDTNLAANTVTEDATIGTTVGITAVASDADATTNAIAYTLDDTAGGRFAIDSVTGVVTVAAALNYETAVSHNITVRATSDDGSFSTQLFTISVTDVNESSITTINDTDATADFVLENATNGTVVGITAFASDADSTDTVSYSLDDNASGRFTIDTVSGIVTVASAIDREAAGTYNIIVRATSTDTSTITGVFTIAIGDVNEFSVGSIADTDAAANSVAEDATIGTTVGITAVASDADATTNAITYTLDDTAGGRFAIDGVTGVVTVAAALDYETAVSHNITVRATSTDSSFSTQLFSINVTDVNESGVTLITDSDVATDFVLENSANGTVVDVTAFASDADGTDTVSYSLDDTAGGRFTIDVVTGTVTVAGAIDREAAGTYTITVRATSTDSSTVTQFFTITIGDVNEFAVTTPVDNDPTANNVNENAVNGTVVGVTTYAFDADGTTNTISYSLDDNAAGRFQINTTTGVVAVLDGTLLDRETAASHSITVRATSVDGSSATQLFIINVNDVNEFAAGPVTDSNVAANSVAEDATIGTTVGITAFASDADATTNSITYTLDDSAGGLFAIDGSTGVVTLAAGLDYETSTSHSITIRATSADGSFSTQVFTISVTNVNESGVTAISDSDATADFVLENSANGTVVGITAFASDADGTDSVSYALDDTAGGRFAIDAVTGIVTVAGAIDREATGSYSITVRATSTDSSTITRVFTITIGDIDEFDVTAITDTNAAGNSVAEDAAIGTTVGITAFASDADATTNAITYTLDDTAGGLFAIDGSTGVVTVAAGLDYETATSHSITIRATSADGSFSTQLFAISVTDVNESGVTTISDSDAAADFVVENATNGTVVGITAFASDTDGTDSVSYSLDDTASGRFAIDAVTGIVTVSGAIDREAAGSYNITVRATSTDSSTITRVFSITIGDVNEFDVTVPTDSDAATDGFDENVIIGTTVGLTANAFDLDVTNNTITYSLTSNVDGLFQIDANTGVVTTAAAIDRELHGASRSITVQAASSGGSTATQSFSIAINDLDEFDVTGVSDTDLSSNSVAEDATIGTTIGITAFASDADATTNSITYTLDDSAGGLFAIDGLTGIVTVASGLDYETATSHSITIRATSADGSFSTQLFAISVTDVNESGVSAISDSIAAADFVLENSTNGTVVRITAFASDADGTDTVSYSLDDTAGGRFTIDAVTGSWCKGS